jgi:hypothetical protein
MHVRTSEADGHVGYFWFGTRTGPRHSESRTVAMLDVGEHNSPARSGKPQASAMANSLRKVSFQDNQRERRAMLTWLTRNSQ